MPAAIQNCHGSQRLAQVENFRADDRAQCPFCTLRLKSTRRIERDTKYYEIPPHRAVGERRPDDIDWSDV